MELYKEMKEKNIPVESTNLGALAKAYAQMGHFNMTDKVLLYDTSLVRARADNKHRRRKLMPAKVLEEIHNGKHSPPRGLYKTLVWICLQTKRTDKVKEYYNAMIKQGVSPSAWLLRRMQRLQAM